MDNMQDLDKTAITEVIDQLQTVTSLKQEVQLLHLISEAVLPVSYHGSNGNGIDEDTVFETDLQPITIEDDALLKLMPYLFNRRFAWKEKPRSSISKKEPVQQEVISLLDQLIQWIKGQHISSALLEGYLISIEQASQNALVRKQTFNLATEWLKAELSEEVSDEHFVKTKELLLLGIQDIWSAIRNLVVSRLSAFVEVCSLSQLETFFNQMVKICHSEESSWQSQEGAIMAINTIIRRFQWIGIELGDIEIIEEEEAPSPRTEYFLKFGTEELAGLPTFITRQIKPTVFLLLAHPQLTVREHATKAFSSYLARSDFKEALISFKDIVDQLCRDVPPSCQPHLAYLSPKYKAMDAYEAEGLLGVCVCLVKHIPPGFMLPNWPSYISAFCLYLAHPASTVRQTASNIFKFLVAKDSHNPLILRLVLQGLTTEWSVDPTTLSSPSNKALSPAQLTAKSRRNEVNGQKDVSRVSVMNVASSPGNLDLSNSWEWREGRLFAYEVICQFLVKNHIIYMFGSLNDSANLMDREVNLPQPGSSVDASLFPRLKREAQDQKTHSFNEPALKQSLRRTYSDKNYNRTQNTNYRRFNSQQKHEDIREDEVQLSLCSVDDSERNSVACGLGESPTSKLLSRLPTVAGLCAPSLKTLVKHYSYYTQGSQPFAAPAGMSMGKATSLLFHSLVLQVNQSSSTHRSGGEIRVTKSKSDRETLRSCLCPSPIGDSDADGWLEEIRLDNVGHLLQVMLYQTIESLADSQWELRRMGHQLLPLVVEVMRWYDMSLLEDLWNTYLRPVTSLMTYGACLALQHSLVHAVRLLPMLKDPPSTWQDGELCRDAVLRITGPLTTTDGHLSTWLNTVQGLLSRPCYDKLTITAIHILMVAHSHLPMSNAAAAVHVCGSVSVINRVFLHAHPGTKLAQQLQSPPVNPSEFHTPVEGFLSCILLKGNGVQSCAKQVEKCILNELSSSFVTFLIKSDIGHIVSLLPVFAFYIAHYTDMDTIQKNLLDSVSVVINRCTKISLDQNHIPFHETIKINCILALKELIHAITLKTMELTVLRSLLDMSYSLCSSLNDVEYCRSLLQAMISRLSHVAHNGKNSSVLPSGTTSSLAPAVPVVTIHQQESQSSETDDELDPEVKTNGRSESQMLNLSCLSSSSRTSRTSGDARPASVSEEDPEDSDWDSWDDDEEEEQEALRTVLSEYLQNFLKSSLFKMAMEQLSPRDRRTLGALL